MRRLVAAALVAVGCGGSGGGDGGSDCANGHSPTFDAWASPAYADAEFSSQGTVLAAGLSLPPRAYSGVALTCSPQPIATQPGRVQCVYEESDPHRSVALSLNFCAPYAGRQAGDALRSGTDFHVVGYAESIPLADGGGGVSTVGSVAESDLTISLGVEGSPRSALISGKVRTIHYEINGREPIVATFTAVPMALP